MGFKIEITAIIQVINAFALSRSVNKLVLIVSNNPDDSNCSNRGSAFSAIFAIVRVYKNTVCLRVIIIGNTCIFLLIST